MILAPNHAYVVDFASRVQGRVLDFGCGAGEVVEAARCYGADIFNRRNDSLRKIAAKGLGGAICIIEESRLPYRDETFDMVVSNQVFEHVHELDATLAEVARVLKPGGVFLALFPSDEVWREGHCGVPFVHWFDRRSRLRLPYMLAARRLGLGAKKDARPIRQWALDFFDYIDNYTIYRRADEIEATFARHFKSITHIETPYCQYRLRRLGMNTAAQLAGAPVMNRITSWLCRKLATMVMVCRRID